MSKVNAVKIAGRLLADVEKMNAAYDALARLVGEIEALGDNYQEAVVSLEVAAVHFERAKESLALLAGTLVRLYNDESKELLRP